MRLAKPPPAAPAPTRAAAAVAPSGVCPRCSAATTAVAEDVRRARMFKARFFFGSKKQKRELFGV